MVKASALNFQLHCSALLVMMSMISCGSAAVLRSDS